MKYSSLLLCVICVLVFIVQNVSSGFTDLFVLDSSLVAERPWTLITSIFLHGSAYHLLSNLFALGVFGIVLENIIGTRKFLLVFFATGLLASLSALTYESSLGASGAIFGILGALAAMRPRLMVWTYGVPMPMFVAAAFWLLLDIAGAFYPSNVANLAHIIGLFAGLLMGIFLRRSFSESRPSKKEEVSDGEFNDWENEQMM